MPTVSVYQGEVRSYSFSFPRSNNGPHHQWAYIREGEYVIDIPGQKGYVYKVFYKKRPELQNAEEDILDVTIDARIHTRLPMNANDPNFDAFFHIDFEESQDFRDCLLSIDLGNTRTVSLLVDGIDKMLQISDGSNDIDIYPVPMNWHFAPEGKPISGVFESIISTVNTSATVDLRCSFLRLGDFAVYNNRAFSGINGRYTLSSPKRYYWDNDPCSEGWVAASYASAPPQITDLDNPLANMLVKRFKTNQDASKLPPAAMLAAMVVELYEQAVFFVSTPEFKQRTHDDHPRKISKVHITYPSTLSPEEKEIYRTCLQEGLNSYLFLCGNKGDSITLCSDIDEATAVLAFYVFSEIKKHIFAKFWIQTIGHLTHNGAEARIAVIDIGGGTTDLSISNVSVSNNKAAVSPSEADISLLYRDGSNSAGDILVLTFLSNAVARIVLQKILDIVGAPAETDVNWLLREYNDPENNAKVKGLKRDFWFDLTINLAVECDHAIENELVQAEESQNTPKFVYDFSKHDKASLLWINLLTDLNVGTPDNLQGASITIPILSALVEQYKRAVRGALGDAPRAFGRAICAFNTDLLLFSGKTAELSYVRKLFEDYAPVSDMYIQCMKDFKVGNWCPEITDSWGRIRDSKHSTALGGALFTLKDKAFVTINFDFSTMAANPICAWGVAANPERPVFPSAASLFANGENQAVIPLNRVSVFISRKNACASRYILSYQIRVKPQSLLLHPGGLRPGASVTLEKDLYRIRLSLVGCEGSFADGTPLKLDDVECRICNATKEFGLDNESI